MRYLFIILLSLILSKVLLAEDTTVEMLNKLEKRNMVFSQEIVRINPGDTVFWKATDKGHNVAFISKNGVPEGVEDQENARDNVERFWKKFFNLCGSSVSIKDLG